MYKSTPKAAEKRGVRGAHRSVLGVLRLVGVVIQSDEVETRLHLIAPASEHVLPAYALSRVRVAAARLCVSSHVLTPLLNAPLKLTYCSGPPRGRSHMVCSRPCRWTDPSAPAKTSGCLFLDWVYLIEKAIRDPHHTLVAGVPMNQTLAEAAARVRVAGASARQRAQWVTGARCQNTPPQIKTGRFLTGEHESFITEKDSLRRQPSGPRPIPKYPCLQLSQRSPSTLALHRHWPEIRPATTSVCASHRPPCRDPSGSQLHAREIQRDP